MKFDVNETPAYTLLKTEEINELHSVGLLLEHNKTKAKIAVMLNDDNNKVFSVGFRTPVDNDTGVPHIVEHTVLCGSKKYPLKDPFVELAKGSLNTFLNAMTFPDKTIYPIASYNDKDFSNLMDIYLDCVFNPKIFEREEIFLQEGWHYEFDENDDLTVNGIVYNEMKGAFSKPEEIMARLTMVKLFPDTIYKNESGGAPMDIPTLTYEDYLEFYKKYYHPSNSYIYLYGDLDLAKKLNYIDEEYLSKYDYLEVDSEIKSQEPFEEVNYSTDYYSIGENEDTDNKTYLAYTCCTGDGTDKNLFYAMKVLDYALLSMPGAPLKKALVDAGIGTDVYGGSDTLKQKLFSIIAKCANPQQKGEFEKVINETLDRIFTRGIDKTSLLAAINIFEFNYREADFGSYPKGIFYLIDLFDSWLYDVNEPFTHLKAKETFDFLKEMVNTDYYEKLVKKYFIDNKHKAVFSLEPKAGLDKQKDEEQKARLKTLKDSLSEEEIIKLKEKEKKLEAFHNYVDSEEDLKKIPLLSISDIDKAADKINIVEKPFKGEKLLFSKINTNGIAYLNVSFNINKVSKELLPYVGLLKYIIGNVDTKSHSYQELSNIINLNSGGLVNDVSGFVKVDSKEYNMYFETKTKVFYDKIEIALQIIKELLLETKYTDTCRIKEILAEIKSSLEASILGSGDSKAVQRANASLSEPSFVSDKISGIDFYLFVKDMYKSFDLKKEEFSDNLSRTINDILTIENMLVHITAEDDGFDIFSNKLSSFVEAFSDSKKEIEKVEFIPKYNNYEGIKTSSAVQFVARCGLYTDEGYEYNGYFKVLSNVMNYGYLWKNIRENGGAYGCSFRANRNGMINLVSYRDPKLKETNEVYDKIPEFLRSFNPDEREMTKYIIGAISILDVPKMPKAKGQNSYVAYQTNVTDEMLQLERDQVLLAKKENLTELVRAFEAALSQDVLCVIGSGTKIEESKEMFNKIIDLFE